MRNGSIVFSLVFGSFLSVAACGSRGPLDIEIVEAANDAGIDADATTSDANDGGDAPSDALPDATDAKKDATLIDCGACLVQQCGQPVLECIQDPACQTALQCAVQKCFAAGNPSPSCLFQCASDPAGTAGVLQILTCVTGKCGSDCTSLLGVLGGLGGGGGGGGGRRDAGKRLEPSDIPLYSPSSDDTSAGASGSGMPEEERRAILRQSFAHWPEISAL